MLLTQPAGLPIIQTPACLWCGSDTTFIHYYLHSVFITQQLQLKNPSLTHPRCESIIHYSHGNIGQLAAQVNLSVCMRICSVSTECLIKTFKMCLSPEHTFCVAHPLTPLLMWTGIAVAFILKTMVHAGLSLAIHQGFPNFSARDPQNNGARDWELPSMLEVTYNVVHSCLNILLGLHGHQYSTNKQ